MKPIFKAIIRKQRTTCVKECSEVEHRDCHTVPYEDCEVVAHEHCFEEPKVCSWSPSIHGSLVTSFGITIFN